MHSGVLITNHFRLARWGLGNGRVLEGTVGVARRYNIFLQCVYVEQVWAWFESYRSQSNWLHEVGGLWRFCLLSVWQVATGRPSLAKGCAEASHRHYHQIYLAQ